MDFKLEENNKNHSFDPVLSNQQGEELFRKGDLSGALNQFIQTIQTDPNFSLAHNNLGVVYWQTQRKEEAVTHFVRALEIDNKYYNNVSNCYQAYNALATLAGRERDPIYPFLLARLAGGILKFYLPGIDTAEQIKWLDGFKSILISLEIKLKSQTVNDLNPSEKYFLSAYRYCICSIYLRNNTVSEQALSSLKAIHSSLVRMDLWQLGCLDQYDCDILKKIILATNSVKGTFVKYEQYFACFALMLFDKPLKIALSINSDAVYLEYLDCLKQKSSQQNDNVYRSRVLSNLGLPVEKALWYVENYADISKFKDKHSGESCFIIGNGPSLRKMDLSPLRHRIAIGMNKIHLLFDKLGFQTTYLAVANPYVIQQAAKEISNLAMPRFIMLWGREFIKKDENIIFLRENQRHLFVKDIAKGVCVDATVTYMAMQIAYYMGFKTVILIGVDHFFESKGQPHSTVQLSGGDPNHFDPNYFGYGLPWQLPDLAGSEIAYQRAKNVYEADGRCILDATVEGKLKIFQKISYDEALKLTGLYP